MSLDHIQEELDEIYNFDYKFSVMKLFTINDKGAMFARSICGIGEALKGFIFQFRHENEINAKLTEENDKLKEAIQDKNALLLKWGDQEKENKELKEENEELKKEIRDNEGSYDEIEYKKLKDMSKDMVKNTLICAIKESTISEEELDLKMTWGHKYIDEYRNDYDKMYQEIINELNEEDFNEDNNRSKLVLDTNRLLSYEFIDTDDETDEED